MKTMYTSKAIHHTLKHDFFVGLSLLSADCEAQVGMTGGEQIVEVGSNCTNGRMDRMILQTLGRQYEHTRPDRDSYITVNYGNIQTEKEMEFDILPDSYAPIIPYDYDSLMHFSTSAYSDGLGPH